MSELGDVLGSDFESKYEEKTQRNRQQRVSIEKETVMAICHEAVNGEGFDGENPRFRYKGTEIPHDVLLMETYDGDLGKFKNSFENGGMSLGMFHLDTLMSCAFNEDMLDVVNKIKPDSYYLVIGSYEEKKVQKDGEENTYYNVNPVRAVVPLHRAKQLADKYEGTKDASSIEEQKEDQSGSESSSSDDSTSDDEKILQVLNAIGKKKEDLIENTAAGDETALKKITTIADKNLDIEVSQDHVVRVFEAEVQEIDNGEDEEDDDLDLGDDLDMGTSDDSSDDDDDDAGGDESDVDDSTEDASDDEEDDGDETPDDWF